MPGTSTPRDQHSGRGHGRTVRPFDEPLPASLFVRPGSTKARPCQSVAGCPTRPSPPQLSALRPSLLRPSPLLRRAGGASFARRPRSPPDVSRARSRFLSVRSRLRRSDAASGRAREAEFSRAAGYARVDPAVTRSSRTDPGALRSSRVDRRPAGRADPRARLRLAASLELTPPAATDLGSLRGFGAFGGLAPRPRKRAIRPGPCERRAAAACGSRRARTRQRGRRSSH